MSITSNVWVIKSQEIKLHLIMKTIGINTTNIGPQTMQEIPTKQEVGF